MEERSSSGYGTVELDEVTRSAVSELDELVGEVGYDQAHPCPKCEGMLRAVGMSEVRHTQSGTGSIVARSLGPPLPHLLAQRYGVCAPLHILLREEFQVTIQAGAAAAC